MLFRAAELMRAESFTLAALMTLRPARRAARPTATSTRPIDFLEYYGREMLRLGKPRRMGHVPGEHNVYFYEPRGVALVIAPWNFPLAILTGMTAAALVAGNPVIVKPAGPTPLIAAQMVTPPRGGRRAARHGQLPARPGRRDRRLPCAPPGRRPHRLHRLHGGRAAHHQSGGSEPRRRRRQEGRSPRWAARTRSSSTPTPTSTWPSARSSSRPSTTRGRSAPPPRA